MPDQPDGQARELAAARAGPICGDLDDRDPERHRVHEDRRPAGRDHRQGQVHQDDAARHLAEGDGQDHRQVAAVERPEPSSRGLDRHDHRQGRGHAQEAVGERRQVPKARLRDRPMDAPDQAQTHEEEVRPGLRHHFLLIRITSDGGCDSGPDAAPSSSEPSSRPVRARVRGSAGHRSVRTRPRRPSVGEAGEAAAAIELWRASCGARASWRPGGGTNRRRTNPWGSPRGAASGCGSRPLSGKPGRRPCRRPSSSLRRRAPRPCLPAPRPATPP